MIQRQQSLWLLLSTLAAIFSFTFSFYAGTVATGGMTHFEEVTAGFNFFLLILTGASILLSAITIFLYKDRKAQLKLTIGGIALSVLLLGVYFAQVKKFENGNFTVGCVFALAILVGYVMAARGIWKDQKLVKSLDKLR